MVFWKADWLLDAGLEGSPRGVWLGLSLSASQMSHKGRLEPFYDASWAAVLGRQFWARSLRSGRPRAA